MSEAGGGIKKVLYTLATAQRIGLKNSTKALTANNTCKACGLGMGGQLGGMTNELGEFPSVCNKSVQAQSTDIQPPIPKEIFEHSLEDLRALTSHEIEHLGRLGHPLHKAAGETKYKEIPWEDALAGIAKRFEEAQPQRTFFYSSGRSSNEAGFVLQLLARLYGTNNVSNCSFYCHQATGVALQQTIGTGTATIELNDLAGCDLLFLIGANPASNHPRLMHKLIELRRRGGHVVVINPMREPGLVKFAAPKMISSLMSGGDDVASLYLQPATGTDVELLTGIAKAVNELGGVVEEFKSQYTQGFDEVKAHLEQQSWDEIVRSTGVAKETIFEVAKLYCNASNAVFAWGMGITHHLHGVQNIHWISNLALMRGMIGRPNAGLLPLRGHSNVQGIGTVGVKPVLSEDVFNNIEAAFDIRLPTQPGYHTLESLEAAYDGRIDVALMMGGNLYEASPNTQWTHQALDRIPTKVYLTTTLNRGHVHGVDQGEVYVLPVCARDEEPEPTTQESMFNFVRLSDGGIQRIASARSETSVLVDLGLLMLKDTGMNFGEFKRHSRVREAIAKVVPGLEQLKDIEVAKREFYVRNRILHTPEFKTPSGKAQMLVSKAEGQAGNASFVLMSMRSEGQFNSIVYEEKDTYRGSKDRWVVFMHQQDVLEIGASNGSKVSLRSAQGEMRDVRVQVMDIARGCVACYYPEANVLTARDVDPQSFTPAFKSVRVDIEVCGSTD